MQEARTMKQNATQNRPLEQYSVEVSNFGPIIGAKVDLRPLTVFVGPSNTGKSYLAILIYALHRTFAAMSQSTRTGYTSQNDFCIFEDWDRSNELINSLVSSLDKHSSELNGQHTQPITLEPVVVEAIRLRLENQAKVIADEIQRCFGVGRIGSLIRTGRKKIPSSVKIRSSEQKIGLSHVHHFKLNDEPQLQCSIAAELPVSIERQWLVHFARLYARPPPPLSSKALASSGRVQAAKDFLTYLERFTWPDILGNFFVPAYYLPAGRTGVMQAHSVVVSALIAGASVAALRPASKTSVLSGVLSDFLDQLISIGHHKSGAIRRRTSDLATSIEEQVIQGNVHTDTSNLTGYQRFVYRPQGWQKDLELTHSSSMVSELAPIVLYLRHLVGTGDVLFVEEPESCLHPEMQVKFTREIAKIVNDGIKVIVTTHSEWVLEELANIVNRSQAKEVESNDKNIRQPSLRPDQVGVWLFEKKSRPKGSIVSEINISADGLYPSGYERVAQALHNEWADNYSHLSDQP